ncbi:DUF4352 domain-containing protein [Mycobacterium sp. NPDC003323]
MTTPPTTAGWYPDPDGSGGQRYWDGAEWTAQRPDAPESTEETSAWPAELPPWPEDEMAMPSWEDAGKADPEPVVVPDEPEPVAPDEPAEPAEAEPVDSDLPEPVAADTTETTEAVEPVVPDAPEVHPLAEQTTTVVPLTEQPTAVVEAPVAVAPPPPAEPAPFAGPMPVSAEKRSPLKGYLIGVGALAVVLVGVLVWAFAFAGSDGEVTEAGATDVTTEATGSGETTAAATDSAAPDAALAPAEGSAVDGDVTITQTGIEIVPTVSAVDNEFLTKTAAGQFVVVKLNFLNNGTSPATFLSDQQVLTAGGQPFSPDTEATFYLGGISAVLDPGQPVDVSIAFDVPADANPEALQVFGDLGSAGATIPLT